MAICPNHFLQLLLIICLLMETITASKVGSNGHFKLHCMKKEMSALLKLKQGLTDPSNRLLSWTAEQEDCCLWNGVRCDNKTGHVTMLDLRNSGGYYALDTALTGEISPSIQDLESLSYLDLSYNDFSLIPIPEFLGSLAELRYLNLSMARFSGIIPSQIGNLSNLQYLDLYSGELQVDNLDWLSRLSALRHLDLSGINVGADGDWLAKINHLSSLRELHMIYCGLGEISSVPTHVNFTSLEVLDLHLNNLLCSILKPLANLNSLVYLDMSNNNLHCSFPPQFLNKTTSLRHLDMSNTLLQGPISNVFNHMMSFEYLDLSNNLLEGLIPDVFDRKTSLAYLDLSKNNLSGSLPESIKQLSELVVFDVGENSLKGVISDSNLINLSKLQKLVISSNSFRCKFSSDWIPPLQLNVLQIRSCSLGPLFPAWLQKLKNLSVLDISDNGIRGTIPSWYRSTISSISNLTSTFSDEVSINLSSNQLEGPIPQMSPNITSMNLSKNLFSGTTFASICKVSRVTNALSSLDLSHNRLTGNLPDCWMYWPNLSILSLANNSFSGEIPSSIGYMDSLLTLHLRHNNFTGGLPFSLTNCSQLTALDVGENNLSGSIPPWIGESLQTLVYLVMNANNFNGHIPSELCNLSLLRILELAHNNIQGTIPSCFANFSNMATNEPTCLDGYSTNGITPFYVENTMLMWKGKEHEYMKNLQFVKMIDLSSNRLTGIIPEGVTDLIGLIALNLSGNHLTGTIPDNIYRMGSLEFLDLSRNQLSGVIPMGLAKFTLLNGLDLSYNNLSGPIPVSTQLQSFDASSFMGNDQLCGPPLLVNCTRSKALDQDRPGSTNEDDDEVDNSWLYIGVGVGYIVGFWVVCASLLFNRPWRITYFRFVDEYYDWVYVVTILNLRKLQRRLRSN